jgi:DNA polymerase-3 subunit delta'
MPIVNLSNLLGQPETSAFLRGVVGSGRIGNAYLFHGPSGVGKGTAALAFARALLCEHAAPDPTVRPAPEAAPSLFDAAPAAAPAAAPTPAAAPLDDACGRCSACLKSAALQHPDLKFLFPVSGEEKELDNTIGETLAALREDPWFVFQYEKAASIRLSLTRELLRELAYKPYEASRRVVVVRDAERMREDQYSALLKSIEEPGASTVWVLTTARLARLPATIRSRCQRVRFAPLGEPLIAGTLENSLAVPALQARMLAALSGGSLARAIVLREEDPVKSRNEALELLEPALRGDGPGLWKAAQGYTKFGRAGRETLRRLIEFHHLWLRDLLRARYDAPREALINRDREADLRRQAVRLDATEIRRRLMVLEEMLRAIEGNVSADLTLFSGASRIAGERLGEGGWPAHATARWDY